MSFGLGILNDLSDYTGRAEVLFGPTVVNDALKKGMMAVVNKTIRRQREVLFTALIK